MNGDPKVDKETPGKILIISLIIALLFFSGFIYIALHFILKFW